jgi:hypothetical protein
MKNKEKVIIALIIGWSTIHIILYQSVGNNNCIKQHSGLFWPIDGGALKCTYDITELLTYVLTPIVMYVVYKLLSLVKAKE